MKLNTLNNIIDDLLLLLRNNNIAESENLSKIQIELWIHQYRAYLLKQDLDKGRDVNPEYTQVIGLIHVSETGSEVPGKVEYISDDELPSFIDLHYGSGLLTVKDAFGNLIQVGNETKAKYQKYRKYGCGDYIAYIKGKHLYLEGPGDLEYVELIGILEDPTEAGPCFDADAKYPMPANLIPALKHLILDKEFNVLLSVPSDETNDSRHDVQNLGKQN